jgi:hypothetical protein
MMTRYLLASAAILAAFALPAITAPIAQAQVQNGTLVIFGNDRCPTNAEGEEIVVCVRRSERERFRIPKELRDVDATDDKRSWAVRAQGALDAGATGVGSCSTVGAGGASGCFVQRANAARADSRARREAASPLP